MPLPQAMPARSTAATTLGNAGNQGQAILAGLKPRLVIAPQGTGRTADTVSL